MKIMKRFAAAAVVALTLGVGSATAFAAQYTTPADAVAGITGREVQSVVNERVSTGKTYGTIASEAGLLDEFKDAVYEIKKERVQELVADGSITQADADEILTIIKERQAICDGTGNGGDGLGIGRGRKTGGGNGAGRSGMGNRLNGGSCPYR